MSGSPKAPKPPKAPKQTAAEARAEAQATAAAGKADRTKAIAERFGERVPGQGLLRATQVTTAIFVAATLVAAIVDTREVRIVVALLDSAFFVAGCVLFLAALWAGAQRSREADLTMSGWWFLSGSAPTSARVTLLGAVAVQIAVGVAGAAFRFGSLLAFGILVPTLGLAFCGLWGARHGLFPPRRFVEERVEIPRRRSAKTARPVGRKSGEGAPR